MSEFMNGLFADTSKVTGINLVDTENNQILNEAIILDSLNGDTEALARFFDNLGPYGARDGILSECANIDTKCGAFGDKKCADCAAILAVAKESNSKDYELYMKSIMLMKACMDNMKAQYGNIAEKRLNAQKAEVESNPRVVDAIAAASTPNNL